jgi:hypothetical protein
LKAYGEVKDDRKKRADNGEMVNLANKRGTPVKKLQIRTSLFLRRGTKAMMKMAAVASPVPTRTAASMIIMVVASPVPTRTASPTITMDDSPARTKVAMKRRAMSWVTT